MKSIGYRVKYKTPLIELKYMKAKSKICPVCCGGLILNNKTFYVKRGWAGFGTYSAVMEIYKGVYYGYCPHCDVNYSIAHLVRMKEKEK